MPRVELDFDELSIPLEINIQIDCGIITERDHLFLVPVCIPFTKIRSSLPKLPELSILRTGESHGTATISLKTVIKNRFEPHYLTYVRLDKDGAKVLAVSRKFSFGGVRKVASAVWNSTAAESPQNLRSVPLTSKSEGMRASHHDMFGADCSLDEWTRELLNSSRVEEEKEQARVIQMLSRYKDPSKAKARLKPKMNTNI